MAVLQQPSVFFKPSRVSQVASQSPGCQIQIQIQTQTQQKLQVSAHGHLRIEVPNSASGAGPSSLLFKPSLGSPIATGQVSSCCQIQTQQKLQYVPSASGHFNVDPKPNSSSSCGAFCGSGLRLALLSRGRSSSIRRAAPQEADDGSSSISGGNEDGDLGFEVEKALESVLQSGESANLLDNLAETALQDEESKALLNEFATAAERVARAKQELESIDRRERDFAETLAQMANKAVDEEVEIAALVTESERAVLEAEEELKAAELALVTARAGGSVDNLSRKWESYDIDEDIERVESGKAAAVSVLAGTIASIPFYLTGSETGIGCLLSIGGVVVSCALFGVTYRYILRRDLGNIQLKSGAAAAFSVVRGIGQVDAIQLQVGYPTYGGDEVMLASLNALQGFFIFGFSALALDYCLREAFLSPFPLKKS